jgi:predicted dienelactone hydrolase
MTLAHELHTVQCEELASHGYIVVSIGHPGGGSYELPSGEIILFDMQKAKEEAEANSVAIEVFNQFAAWLGGAGKTAAPDEHHPHYQSVIDSQPEVIMRANIWIKDSLAAIDWILDQVEQPGTLLHDRVDTDKIGAFGMSFGGSTAMSISLLSDAIKAAANLDGFFYSTLWQQPLSKPILLMNNDSSFGGFLRFPYLNAQGDAYLATVSETTHGSFIDYTEILAENEISKRDVDGEEVELPLLGSIDPDRMEIIMNTFLLDFFDKYLKGEASRVIDTENVPEEVELLRKQQAAETASD